MTALIKILVKFLIYAKNKVSSISSHEYFIETFVRWDRIFMLEFKTLIMLFSLLFYCRKKTKDFASWDNNLSIAYDKKSSKISFFLILRTELSIISIMTSLISNRELLSKIFKKMSHHSSSSTDPLIYSLSFFKKSLLIEESI